MQKECLGCGELICRGGPRRQEMPGYLGCYGVFCLSRVFVRGSPGLFRLLVCLCQHSHHARVSQRNLPLARSLASDLCLPSSASITQVRGSHRDLLACLPSFSGELANVEVTHVCFPVLYSIPFCTSLNRNTSAFTEGHPPWFPRPLCFSPSSYLIGHSMAIFKRGQ